MAQNSPNAMDVIDIQFKLYAKTKVLNSCDSLPNNVSLLAVSSARGLLFVGDAIKAELKVFMLNNLIDTENICGDILARVVPLPGFPNIVVCSCDGSMLAVAFTQNNSSFLQIFNVPSFLTSIVNPIYTIKLAMEENVAALQILWNPVIPGNLAIVMTNGALSMYNLKDAGQYEMHSLDKSQHVQCGCWSPKGKQIVLGFPNGKLQQFKPDLTPAKTIPCPPGVHGSPFSTIAVHWLSTFQFAVAFLQDGQGNVPMLYIVNAPKGGSPSYINYYDVCYATGQRFNQINFLHVQAWNLLLVTSANSVEVGVLGFKESSEIPTWVQYTLLDDARIELPLTETKDETFPLGFAYDTSCTHKLTYNDKLLPIMPMIHVLSTNGTLLSFNFLNLLPGIADVCSPPPPISYDDQHFRALDVYFKSEQQDEPVTTEVMAETVKTPSSTPIGFSSTPLMKDKPSQFFGIQTNNAADEQPIEPFAGFGKEATTSVSQAENVAFTEFGGLTGGISNSNLTNIDEMTGQQPTLDQQSKPQLQPHPQQQQQQQKPQQNLTAAVSGVRSSELNKPLYTILPTFTPPASAAGSIQQPAQPQKSNSSLSVTSKMQSGFLELIQVQINGFDKEIKELALHSKGLLKNLGNPDEMRGCTKRLHDLQEIIEQANDHEFEIDVQNLRHFLNESRAMIAECRWKLEKHNNPDLPRLGNNMSDPSNRRQLSKLQSYVTTNEAQLQTLKLQIDAQWSNFQDSARRHSKSQIHIPCLDGIYQGLTKLQEGLSRHRIKLNQIKMKLQQSGLLYKIKNSDSSAVQVNVENTIESLADSIVSMTLAPVVEERCSKLSNEKLKAIRDFTRHHKKVNLIKPQRPNRVGLNSEVVLETMLQSERVKAREKNASLIAAKDERKEQKQEASETLDNLDKFKPSEPSTASPLKIGNNTNRPFNFSANAFVKPAVSATKDEKSSSIGFNFQAPSMFGLPSNVTSTPQASVDSTITESPATEDNFAVVPQVPISFAAKVISGANTLSKSTPVTFAGNGCGEPTAFLPDMIKTTTAENELKTSETKPFSFSAVTTKSSTNGFGGFGGAEASIPVTKPQLFEVKSGTGFTTSFNFGGFISETNNTASTTTTTTTSTAALPVMSTVASDGCETTKSANGIFSGFGKPVGTQNNMLPFGSMPTVSSSSSEAQNLTKSVTITAVPTDPGEIPAAKPFADLSSTSTATTSHTPTDSVFGTLTICKPTMEPPGSTKTQIPSANIFSGFAESTSFSFAGTGKNLPFGELSSSLPSTEALQITPISATKEAVATTADSSTTVDTVVGGPTISSAASTAKSSDFTFSLSSVGTSVIPTATTASMPTIPLVSSEENVISKPSAIPSIFSSSVTTTTPSSASSSIFAGATYPATSSAVSSAAPTLFGTTFFTASATTTTETASAGGSSVFGLPTATSVSLAPIFGGFSIGSATTSMPTTPSGGGSIFSSATPTAPQPSTNIFGGVSQSEQPLFGGTANASPIGGGNLFANAAPNASPFSVASTSAPPNQNVSGSIFSAASGSFANSAGSIFGGGTSTASTANAVGSPFGASTATPASPGGSIFGGTASNTLEAGSIFSGAGTQQPGSANSAGSIFSQSPFGQSGNTAPPANIFGGANTAQPFGTGSSLFSGSAATNTAGAGGGSIFGGIAAPSSFSSPSSTTGTTGFGAFSQPNTGSPFGSPGGGAGPFGQGGASVAQSGFGSPQQTSAFNKPVFGGPATFGSPPAFGAQPTFGGAPTFGSQKPFGAFAAASPTSPGTGVFGNAGGGAQKNSLFETLGSSDTGLSFGNLAQSASVTGPNTPFGGSSFTSYRS